MKVVLVTSFPDDPNRPHGGVQAVSVNLARSLARLPELEVHVVTTDRETRSHRLWDWEGVSIHTLPWAGGSVLGHAVGTGRRQVSRYVMDLAPDVIHAHDVFGLMVKGVSLPRVFTIHGFIYGDTLVSGERFAWVRSQIWRRIETSGWADQPHIISISPYVRERLAGIASGIIHDIDNPIAPGFFEVERSERPGTLFSAALICPRKNTLCLVDAFANLLRRGVEANLQLAGSAPDPDYQRQVEERIRFHKLEDRIRLLGRLTTDQVREQLAIASAFVLVSLEENSPMGIEEAMAAGVPVVTSNRCGMPYMVRDGDSGYLVDPHDSDDIADRLEDLLSDDTRRASMGEKSRQIACDRFHPDAVARRTYEVYLRAAGQRRRCHAPVGS